MSKINNADDVIERLEDIEEYLYSAKDYIRLNKPYLNCKNPFTGDPMPSEYAFICSIDSLEIALTWIDTIGNELLKFDESRKENHEND